jgi:hypothetical protein
VEIRGIEFLADLVVMDTHVIDVILGMNWLDKNQAVISCETMRVKLMSPSEKEIVAELSMSNPEKEIATS